MKDLANNLSIVQSLAPASRTANANGAAVDLQGYEGALILISTGAITDGTHTFEVQESDDGTTFTAVANSDLIGTEPAVGATNDNTDYKIGYIGSKRYVRVVVTVAGATNGGVYGAWVIRGYPRHAPVA